MNNRLSQKNIKRLGEHFIATGNLQAELPPEHRKKRDNEESREQKKVIAWWASYSKERGIPECLLFAIPNGSALGHGKEEYQVRQRKIRGKIMKEEGLRNGCPDLFCAVGMGISLGLFVEMKTAKGVISDDQKEFIHALRKYGYLCDVCRSAEEGIAKIKEYLT